MMPLHLHSITQYTPLMDSPQYLVIWLEGEWVQYNIFYDEHWLKLYAYYLSIPVYYSLIPVMIMKGLPEEASQNFTDPSEWLQHKTKNI